MRLINAKTLELVDVWEDQDIKYAILSHRWTHEEITLGEFLHPNVATETKSGWLKIKNCATQAVKDGHDYLWVDTCCIDKTSSAELSEAINSMYRWYKESAVCYVYLNDVEHDGAFVEDGQGLTAFEKSQWHTRGWTLQELLAPKTLKFYSRDWQQLSKTKDPHLHHQLSRATGISLDVLSGQTEIETTPIARRMSWASGRTTTRSEDMAYCLLGIFDVNMPLLYGEGNKAFRRLQDEIMKVSTDETLFAWVHTEKDPLYGGLLAPHPRNFKGSADYEDKSSLQIFQGRQHSTTREGIWLSLFINEDQNATAKADKGQEVPGTDDAADRFYTGILKCAKLDSPNSFPTIRLFGQGVDFLRYRELKSYQTRLMGAQQDIHVRHAPRPQAVKNLEAEFVRVKFETNCSAAYVIAVPRAKWAHPPQFRAKAAREAAAPLVAAWKEEWPNDVNVLEQEDQPNRYVGEVPLRRLEFRKPGQEKFWPQYFEAGFDTNLKDLKWTLPALPEVSIAYLRIVRGDQVDPIEIRIATCLDGSIGFASNEPRIDGRPKKVKQGYTIFYRRNDFDRPTSVGEVAEIVISMRHHDPEVNAMDMKNWRYHEGQDRCSCKMGIGNN